MNESDMRNFFEQVVTNFVSLSEQAKQLQVLQSEVSTLNARLTGYVNENERINKSAHEAWELVTMLEKEKAEQAKAIATFDKERDEYEQEITNQNNLIGTYSNDLHEANTKISQLTEMNNSLQDQLTESQRTINSANATIYGIRNDVADVSSDRDYWKRQYNLVNDTIPEYQSRVTVLSASLADAEAQLAKIKAVFMATTAPVAAAETELPAFENRVINF